MEDALSTEFLNEICARLNISDLEKIIAFKIFVKKSAVSYLTGKAMNADRIQPHKQKTVFKNYASALEETKERYLEIERYNSTSANYHDALKDVIRTTDIAGLKEMFHHYITTGDGKETFGSISNTLFEHFLNALIQAAKNAPDYINENDKANLDKDYILWWVWKVSTQWSHFSDVPFTIGDWFKNEELGIDRADKKGAYNSLCLDVLYDLLKAADNKITRKDIETAMRKFKKL